MTRTTASGATTPLARLISHYLGVPVGEYIAKQRAQGVTWFEIRKAIDDETHMAPSEQTLRNWEAA